MPRQRADETSGPLAQANISNDDLRHQVEYFYRLPIRLAELVLLAMMCAPSVPALATRSLIGEPDCCPDMRIFQLAHGAERTYTTRLMSSFPSCILALRTPMTSSSGRRAGCVRPALLRPENSFLLASEPITAT